MPKGNEGFPNEACTLPTQATKRMSVGYHIPKLAIIMVGLPCRGKSMLAIRLTRYLTWMGFETRTFAHTTGSLTSEETYNAESSSSSQDTLEEMLEWLVGQGRVGILDGHNVTIEARRQTLQKCTARGCDTLFVESVCSNPEILADIFAAKLQTPKYMILGKEVANQVLQKRIDYVSKHYQTLKSSDEENGLSFIKVFDHGKELMMSLVWGYLPGQISMFLANSHTVKRKIWISRHGESEFNANARLGGNSGLTTKGHAYAIALASYFEHILPPTTNLEVYTSTLIRTQQTVQHMSSRHTFQSTRLLNEIDAGVFDGKTYEDMKREKPQEYAQRAKDKFHYRYEGGESYMDLTERLKPIIIELERVRTPVLVVCHQAVVRVLLSYFLDHVNPENCVNLEVPHHQLIELTPNAYGFQQTTVDLQPHVDAVLKHSPRNPVPETRDDVLLRSAI